MNRWAYQGRAKGNVNLSAEWITAESMCNPRITRPDGRVSWSHNVVFINPLTPTVVIWVQL